VAPPLRLARFLTVSSTEPIQEQKAADKDAERNPEVKVGRDGAKQVAGTAGLARRHCDLGMGSLIWSAILGIDEGGVNAGQ